MNNMLRVGSIVVTVLLGWAPHLLAQPVGTFRWQLAPYCNVLTLFVEQGGGGYALTGFDDRCGSAVRAAARGTAHQNPDGTIGLGIAVTRPDGRLLQTSASISLGSFAGTWSDNYGNSGTFIFNPAAPAGPPRAITVRGVYAVNYRAVATGDSSVSPFSFGETLTAAPVAVAANFIKVGQPPTPDCPGSAAFPQAAAGHLCVYEQLGINVAASRCIVRTGTSFSCHFAERYGAGVFTQAIAAGAAGSQGTWAVTIP